MVRSLVAGGGDGLQIWRVAVNILNPNRHGQPIRGGPPAWRLVEGITIPPHEETSWLRNVIRSGLGTSGGLL
jgi:hypothetical protein